MEKQIAAALNVSEASISNVVVDGKTVDFYFGGTAFWARLSRGKFVEKNMRRAAY